MAACLFEDKGLDCLLNSKLVQNNIGVHSIAIVVLKWCLICALQSQVSFKTTSIGLFHNLETQTFRHNNLAMTRGLGTHKVKQLCSMTVLARTFDFVHHWVGFPAQVTGLLASACHPVFATGIMIHLRMMRSHLCQRSLQSQWILAHLTVFCICVV